MSVLSGTEIFKSRAVDPMHGRSVVSGMSYGLSYCGYDIRVDQDIDLGPGEFRLASSVERFTMPTDLVGVVHDKSTWARRGLSVQNTVIEPGWVGYLTLELSNNHPSWMRMMPVWISRRLFPSRWVHLRRGDPIAQVLFHRIERPVKCGYTGKYQFQERGPVEARQEIAP